MLTDQYFSELVELRRHLHMYPEVSNQEINTTKRINDALRDFGLKQIPISLKTGTAAEIIGGEEGPIVAIRADIDALPIQEEADVPFRSKIDGVSHMCGHDVHTVIALGAGIVLHRLRDVLPGKVRILFQPAEELEGGAQLMIEQGLLDGVKAIIGLHNNPDLEVGTIGVKEGFLMASIDDFIIKIIGKGGHAGIPDKAVDPIVIGSAVVSQLQTLVSRMTSPNDTVVVTVGSFQAGSANNVIPNTATLTGTVRTSNEAVRYKIQQQFQQLVTNLVHSFGAEVELDYQMLMPAVVNDNRVVEIVRKSAIETVGEKCVVRAQPTMGGEDFSLYQQVIPGCYSWLGSGNKEKGISHGWHHPQFMVDEEAIRIGVKWMVHSVIHLLKDETIS